MTHTKEHNKRYFSDIRWWMWSWQDFCQYWPVHRKSSVHCEPYVVSLKSSSQLGSQLVLYELTLEKKVWEKWEIMFWDVISFSDPRYQLHFLSSCIKWYSHNWTISFKYFLMLYKLWYVTRILITTSKSSGILREEVLSTKISSFPPQHFVMLR